MVCIPLHNCCVCSRIPWLKAFENHTDKDDDPLNFDYGNGTVQDLSGFSTRVILLSICSTTVHRVIHKNQIALLGSGTTERD